MNLYKNISNKEIFISELSPDKPYIIVLNDEITSTKHVAEVAKRLSEKLHSMGIKNFVIVAKSLTTVYAKEHHIEWDIK